jgi:diguanylate cyclase (GGDEF)-like protein
VRSRRFNFQQSVGHPRGGEEYAILLPRIDVAGAMKIAERLRNVVANAVIDGDDGPIKVTLSAGVASLDETCADLGALFSRADKAMYDAKRSGRNRVCLFEAS